MSFTSLNFLLFVTLALVVYFITPRQHRWAILLAASYIFYAINSVKAVAFIVTTTISVFYLGRLLGLQHIKEKEILASEGAAWSAEEKKRHRHLFIKKRRYTLALGLLINFGILAGVKYISIIFDGLNTLIISSGGVGVFPEFHLLLPLGISFYTFQSLGYLIDVYRGKHEPDKSLFRFALFVSFFPQIVQGPIGRYSDLAQQLYEPHDYDYTRVKYGVQLIAWGMFKKLVLADRAAILTNIVIPNSGEYSGIAITFTMLVQILRIYADFSGGIDIARGVAQCFGVDMAENFARPNFAISVTDYWRRWHITLGGWTRDYVFYTLSLSKAFGRIGKAARRRFKTYGKNVPTSIAMFIVFFIVGIWHGAELKYIAFGVYYGSMIVGGILLEPLAKKFYNRFPSISLEQPLWRIFVSLRTFFVVAIGKYISTATTVGHALRMLKASFTSFCVSELPHFIKVQTDYGYRNILILCLGVVLMFVVGLIQERGTQVRDLIARQNIVGRWAVYLIMLFSILLFSITGSNAGFMYARF